MLWVERHEPVAELLEEGETLHLREATEIDVGTLTLHVGHTESTVTFTIQDVGPGLPAELPDLTYKPFVKKDALPIGTGIGLPLAKRYAHSLGGSLIIDTDYHEGCRIVIEMPR